MDHLKEDILSCLKDLKGSGKFISVHTTDFQFPGLEVNGVGEIAYPINEMQANALIQVAQKAPFGKGSKTIVDNTVRSTSEIDASQLTFNGKSWAVFLDKIINKIKPDLGLEDYTISAHLYKMLIYEKGDFFLPHKDSEKEKGMFGTLVISLPSKHTGGELVVSFEGVKEVADFAEDSGDYKINYAAFYADCDHEIKPLTSGYRICLVYNLVQQKSNKKIQLTTVENYATQLAEILIKEQERGNTKPHIVLLGHQYTPENFSIDRLKLNDRPKAEALLRAAQKAGHYAKLCLVTSYVAGAPEDEGGYYDDDDDEVDEDAEMGEVYDQELSIEHWLENGVPPLNNLSFEEADLIASFALDEDEPIMKESTGYMGNYGPDLMHWYHYGAVVIWTQQTNAQLLLEQNTQTKLEWIGYFNKNLRTVSDSEITAAELILSTGLANEKPLETANFNLIADWIICRKDETFFLGLNHELCQFYFTKIDTIHWLKLIGFFPAAVAEKIFLKVTQSISLQVVEQVLALLRTFSNGAILNQIVTTQIKNLPDYFPQLQVNSGRKQFPVTSGALDDLFWIEKKIPQNEAWVKRMAEILTSSNDRKYMNHLLIPQLLAVRERSKFTDKIMLDCRQYLQQRVNDRPQPPVNWCRPMPSTTSYSKQWGILKTFLESPDQQVFDYKKIQNERNEMVNAISNAVIDLKTETIRKGSPQTLRITKTQEAYHREMKKWEEDLELLNKIIKMTEG